jgi:hypothetical protein
MSDLLPLGLAFLCGLIFGYATCLWRWCAAEEASASAKAEQQASAGLNRGVRFAGVPLPPPGATQTRIYGGSGQTFMVAHDCIEEGCRAPHWPAPSDHTSCSRRRFGSGCVPHEDGK